MKITIGAAIRAFLEATNPVEMQRDGWQAILERLARHVETQASV